MTRSSRDRPSYRRRSAAEERLNRRVLVTGGALAAAGGLGAAALIASNEDDGSRPEAPTPVPPVVVQVPSTRTPTTPTPVPATPSFDMPPLEYASVAQLRAALDGGHLSAQELVQSCMGRIDEFDGGDLGVAAVLEINPDALEIALVRDRELARGERRGPLHGIPVLVKDLFATADGMATAAGSLALLENTVVRDAFVVTRLREAGAIVLGKTNLSEWSNFRASVQTSGWSARGGVTRNPYQLDMTTWGSSSGSAAAVAAGFAPLALGAETDGSIVCPASATATVGLKPTVGLTSRAGVIPIAFSQDSPGPMARTVEDVAFLLSAIAGFDPEDPAFGAVGWSAPSATFAESPVHEPAAIDYTRFLDPDGLRGARIGVARNLFHAAETGDVVEAILPVLEEAGARLVDPANIPSAEELLPGAAEFQVLITEFPYGLERYLAEYTPGGPMGSLADIVAFNEAHADEELEYFDQRIFQRALDVGTIWDAWYQETIASNLALARDQGIDAVMDEQRLDALIAPTTIVPTAISLGGDDWSGGGACAQVPAMAGYPIVSVPVGYVRGLPVGMSFIGRAFSESTLLKLAYAFEQAYPVRRAPEFLAGSLG